MKDVLLLLFVVVGCLRAQTSSACGKPAISQGRVVGGSKAVRGSWPWQVLMKYNGRGMCGGAIISPDWILTAAHCVERAKNRPERFMIGVGEYDRTVHEGSEVDIRVSKIVIHPGWKGKSHKSRASDIAMMKLAKPIAFSQFVKPVCLPGGNVSIGTKCIVTGWGKTKHPGSMTTVLRQVEMAVVERKVCDKYNKKYLPQVTILNSMLCAGDGGLTNKSGCHGDSGGPLVCKTNGKWELHGTVSFGARDCDSKKSYSVFSRVAYFTEWIAKSMRDYN